MSEKSRGRGGMRELQTHRLVILGPSEPTTDNPAGTALRAQTDCSNLHWQSCQRWAGLPHGDGCQPGRKKDAREGKKQSWAKSHEKYHIFACVVLNNTDHHCNKMLNNKKEKLFLFKKRSNTLFCRSRTFLHVNFGAILPESTCTLAAKCNMRHIGSHQYLMPQTVFHMREQQNKATAWWERRETELHCALLGFFIPTSCEEMCWGCISQGQLLWGVRSPWWTAPCSCQLYLQ